MDRESAAATRAGPLAARGFEVAASFSRSTSFSSASAARAKIFETSPPVSRARRSWSRRTTSRVSRSMSTCMRNVSGDRGSIDGLVVVAAGREHGGVDEPGFAFALGAGEDSSPSEVDAGAAAVTDGAAGTARMTVFAGGSGSSPRTISFTSSLVLWRASRSTSRWFASVRCGARIVTVVTLTEPSARRSRITGNRRAARAAPMRV